MSNDPSPPDYSYLSLDGYADGQGEMRGGRPSDNPQNDPDNDVYYICNLPEGALSRCRLVTFFACHSGHHTALEEQWDDLSAGWDEEPSQCGCASHAALAKGAKCVVGYRHKTAYPGAWQWARLFWTNLNRHGCSVNAAQDMADVAYGLVFDVGSWEYASVMDRFVGGDPSVVIRPAGWAQ